VATGSPPDISVIIPVLNDAEALDLALGSTQDYTGVECIVVDGGSSDESAEVAQSRGVKVLLSPPGRARQMNAGAEVAEGRFLLFLHADTRLPEGFDGHVRQILTGSGVAAGAFQLQIDAPSARLRLIEKAANWRSRYLQMPYGDQAIFLRKELFREMGGFPDLPIMEDFQLIRRLQGEGRIVIAPAAVVTSGRRWKKTGRSTDHSAQSVDDSRFLFGFGACTSGSMVPEEEAVNSARRLKPAALLESTRAV